ncbi:MAG TPA: hypothetical protein VFQ44_01510 [Streptosporangiaceae bacterium]|nr:hypothetical protein [Streptosporangiaceae bacterium]
MAKQVDPAAVAGAVPESAEAYGPIMPAGNDSARPAASSGAGTEPGAVAPAAQSASQLGPFPPFHGRRVSWVAVSIVVVGFLIGGLALVFGHHGPIWWLFWTGTGVAVLGLLITFATNTFEDWY